MGRGPSEAEIASAKRRALNNAYVQLGATTRSADQVFFTRFETYCRATVRLIRASNGEAALLKRIEIVSRPDVYVESAHSTWDELYWELRNKQVKL